MAGILAGAGPGAVVIVRLTCGPDDSWIARKIRTGHAGSMGEPVDTPASGSGSGGVAGDHHAWAGSNLSWHLAFGALAVMDAGLTLTDDGLSPGRRYAALAVLAAACAWYAAVGARVLHATPARSRRAALYIAVAIPVTIGLVALTPFGALLFCLLYPHIWTLLTVRRAIAATAITAAATGATALAGTGLQAAPLRLASAIAVGSVLVAVVIGLWINNIIVQSKHRATVIAELAATRSELAELSRQAGVMAERERLARDIHDTLAQGFTSVVLLLEAADAELGPGASSARPFLRDARKTAADNLAEARAMVGALSPPDLRDASLPAALRQLIDRIGPELGVDPQLAVTGTPRPLAANEEVVLLRATQEALTNVRKHAAAARVGIELAYQPEAVTLRITDDGRGFDPAAQPPGFGLSGMRSRVAQVSGTLRVQSAPGAGTTVAVDLPQPQPSPGPAEPGPPAPDLAASAGPPPDGAPSSGSSADDALPGLSLTSGTRGTGPSR
jgi:signal transduction histidine kinase